MEPAVAGAAEDDAFWTANDAIHILPLSYVPLKTRALSRARLIKNGRLESVIELFTDARAGSGQIEPRDLGQAFDIEDELDVQIIKSLTQLTSYDVYSLRTELRRLKIDVDAAKYLRLSAAKQAALAPYMASYVRPLILRVYGAQRTDLETLGDILRLFRDPDVASALHNLRQLAQALGVDLDQVPGLLADYGDVFLSLSYYESCLKEVEPEIRSILDTIDRIRGHQRTRADKGLQAACDVIDRNLTGLLTEMRGLTDLFRARTQDMWETITLENFRVMRALIEAFQTEIGRNICIAVVKAKAWSRHFPDEAAGALTARARIMTSEIRPGIERIVQFNYADTGPEREH